MTKLINICPYMQGRFDKKTTAREVAEIRQAPPPVVHL